jgi:hypothetical protein
MDLVEELFDEAYNDCIIIEHEWEFIHGEEEETCSADSADSEESATDELYADID